MTSSIPISLPAKIPTEVGPLRKSQHSIFFKIERHFNTVGTVKYENQPNCTLQSENDEKEFLM
jgi:hypothetical protein